MFEIVILSLVLLTECMAGFPHSWQCAEGFGKNVSIQTTDIPGSYNVIYCAPVSEIETKWDLRVDTLPNFSANNCIFSSRTEHQGTKRHSWVSIPIQNGNCSRICITTRMYVMYQGCYRLANMLGTGEPYNAYYFVDNAKITGPEYFCNGSLSFHELPTDPPTFHLYRGRMPLDGLSITVSSNTTDKEVSQERDITNECTPLPEGQAGMSCTPRLERGCCYRLQLFQSAPWFANEYYSEHCRHMYHSFCWEGAGEAPGVRRAVPRWAWLLGGALLAALLAALLLLLLRRSPLSRKLREEAAKALEKRRTAVREAAELAATAREARGVGGGGGRVLLLRARDAPPAEHAQQVLLALLELAAPGRVCDLYSAEAVALGAQAPNEWLRQALLGDDVRVLLLQTPAMACLHRRRAGAHDDALTLREPLLPQHVVYRSPHPSDALLQFALRLLVDGPPTPKPYRRYYLATLSDVPVDVFPSVVPYARYELPAATLALLRELNPALRESEQLRAQVEALGAAAKELADYVHSNHNYLADELMFL